ncbi:hypothetical protein EMCRGX_G001921 [Ephydatia muelleri]
MKSLCTSASHFSSLTSLDLRDNTLRDDSIESLLLIIEQCPLEELTRAWDGINEKWEGWKVREWFQGGVIGGEGVRGRWKREEGVEERVRNEFSYEGTQLLRERAKSARSGMKLVLVDPTTTANPPRSTTTANPPRSPTTANPPRSPTTANPPTSYCYTSQISLLSVLTFVL